MKTRNANIPTPAAAKKSPPARKSAAKATPSPSEVAPESDTPKTAVIKRATATRAKQIKKNQKTPPPPSDSKPEQPSGVEGENSPGVVQVIPSTKVGRPTKPVSKRKTGKTKATNLEKVEESKDEVGEAQVVDSVEEEPSQPTEAGESHVVESTKEEPSEPTAENTRETVKEAGKAEEIDKRVVENVGDSALKEQSAVEPAMACSESAADTLEQERPGSTEVTVLSNNDASGGGRDEEEEQDESRDGGDNDQLHIKPSNMEENAKENLQREGNEPIKVFDCDEGMENGEKMNLAEREGEKRRENDAKDAAEEAKSSEEEHREMAAIAKERKNRKEREVFVGGLDRDAVEEDVRKVFEKIGEIVDIRLHKHLSTNKNKGYAFVEYAKKEHAKRALSEMKNPVIKGKRCGTAPSEDNDTLFLGNICNTWTKEAINQKLKDFGIEGVERITLVADVQREGLSRGFAFIEFSCHVDAMFAYKRLQKPDVIFGHPERTVKVAFAEPLREPDPDVMAQVKSVFVDGLPPHWDEDRVREQFKGYGEIVRVCLARNMSSAKRKDFGFVDFSSHEAAVACIDGINNKELDDGFSKVRVKTRLSNPLPKIQAVKGGMCGGFRIGRGDGAFPKFGRGAGRGGNTFNNASFPRDRGFYPGGRGQGRIGFPNEYGFDKPYADFHGRQAVGRGGRRGSFRGGHYSPGGFAGPNLDRQWHGGPDRERGMHYPPRRQLHSPEGHFNRPFTGSHFDDPYLYGDSMHGMKRPLYMRDPDPDFVEPSRIRPRLDYPDPAASFHGNRLHDSYGPDRHLYPHDYYGPDHAGGPHSSFYGGDPPYGGGYYY